MKEQVSLQELNEWCEESGHIFATRYPVAEKRLSLVAYIGGTFKVEHGPFNTLYSGSDAKIAVEVFNNALEQP